MIGNISTKLTEVLFTPYSLGFRRLPSITLTSLAGTCLHSLIQ